MTLSTSIQIYKTVSKLSEVIDRYKILGKSVGLVPTMGALHSGHLALIKEAIKKNDLIIVSIFVNKKQFNNSQDFDSYPRNLEKDVEILSQYENTIVFAPTEKEVFPKPEKLNLDFGILTKVLEAKYRPGHFEGVAEVVNRLFLITQADMAFFGKKDYQQYLLVKSLSHQLKLPIVVIGCNTVRNSNGLALSSRNQLLAPNQKKEALLIYKSLSKAKNMIESHSIEEISEIVNNDFSKSALKLEYFKIVDANTLQEVNDKESKIKNLIGLISAYLGKVRLIDNLTLIP